MKQLALVKVELLKLKLDKVIHPLQKKKKKMKNDEFLFSNKQDKNKLAFNFFDFQQISSIYIK